MSQSWVTDSRYIVLSWAAILGLIFSDPCAAGDGIRIEPDGTSLSFEAVFRPRRYNALTSFPKHHHFMVWEDGRAARNALIVTRVSDRDIGRALLSIGAVPGNNLTTDSWEKRHDLEVPDPDLKVEGTPIEITICFPDGRVLRPGDLIDDSGGRGFDFRFGGHEHLIPEWRSGCVVCLESCPGGRVSNRNYTLRDHARNRARFEEKDDLPPDGTPVRVVFRIRAEE